MEVKKNVFAKYLTNKIVSIRTSVVRECRCVLSSSSFLSDSFDIIQICTSQRIIQCQNENVYLGGKKNIEKLFDVRS